MSVKIATQGAGVTLPPQGGAGIFGTATGPAAGAVLASIAAPPLGVYRADISVALSGTITAAEASNVKLVANGVTVAQLALVAPAASAPPLQSYSIQFTVNSANPVQLQAVALAGAAAVYSVTLVLTRIG